ncbi:MAG TPA: hypothetical protein VGM12_17170 [Trebonia sp.]
MSTQVTNEDGTAADLVEHLSSDHRKGTKGYTDEYLANLHMALHARRRDEPLEHSHPELLLPQQRRPEDEQPALV